MSRRIMTHVEAVKMFCPVTSGGFINNCRGERCMHWEQAYQCDPAAVVENLARNMAVEQITLMPDNITGKLVALNNTPPHKPETVPVEGHGYCGAYK